MLIQSDSRTFSVFRAERLVSQTRWLKSASAHWGGEGAFQYRLRGRRIVLGPVRHREMAPLSRSRLSGLKRGGSVGHGLRSCAHQKHKIVRSYARVVAPTWRGAPSAPFESAGAQSNLVSANQIYFSLKKWPNGTQLD